MQEFDTFYNKHKAIPISKEIKRKCVSNGHPGKIFTNLKTP
jgi:hypothetical protein